MNKTFKEGFLWGGATAANQIEGGFDLGGRGRANTDYLRFIEPEDRKADEAKKRIQGYSACRG